MGILDPLKRWEARADAWAQKRLAPEDFQEAVELDRVLKANWGRFLLAYLGATVTLAALLVGIKRTLPIGEAFVLANVIIVVLATGLVGVWFGYRKHAGKPLWRTALATTTLAAAGAVVGALLARLSSGKDLEAIAVEEVVRYVSVGLLAGFVVSAFVVGATWIRTREARAREAAAAARAERERFAKRTAEAELKLLQAQVEPHFLFNTLANLRYLVQTGSKDALPMLDHLIEYLRTALPEMRADSSTVAREAALARAYLEIIRIRMGGELQFRIDAPADLGEHPLPALMVMSLVENAVKHGIAPIGRGCIDVRVSRAAGRLRVEVEDDGRGVAQEPGNGVGLANIRERLAVLFGDAATLELGPGRAGGALATLEVPSEAA
jgi:signal transduction histidine kinase